MKLRGKKKKLKEEEKKINIPDMIDIDNEDKNVEQIRENNEGHEETTKNKTGKCGCFIY